jgi:hypothetical protein
MYRTLFLSLLLCQISAPSVLRAQGDCRLNLEKLEPIIQRFNPFFADHKWDPATRLEMARMSDDRLLLITQDGCLRHHTQFTLIVDPEVIENRQQFWIDEVQSLLYKVYFGQAIYREFAGPFDEGFEEKLATYGVNRRFNFPIGTRNFLCEIKYDPSKGARITIEMITFIFLEKIELQRTGIPRDQDDGWLGAEHQK